MDSILFIILAGLLGTLSMTTVMVFIHRSGFANADMVRAIGSLITKNYENSLIPGAIIHFISGILFAFVYFEGMNILIAVKSILAAAVMGIFMGIFHGIIVSMMLVMAVSDNHPLEKFRSAGIGVAVAHLVGHVVYGLVVGIVIGLCFFGSS